LEPAGRAAASGRIRLCLFPHTEFLTFARQPVRRKSPSLLCLIALILCEGAICAYMAPYSDAGTCGFELRSRVLVSCARADAKTTTTTTRRRLWPHSFVSDTGTESGCGHVPVLSRSALIIGVVHQSFVPIHHMVTFVTDPGRYMPTECLHARLKRLSRPNRRTWWAIMCAVLEVRVASSSVLTFQSLITALYSRCIRLHRCIHQEVVGPSAAAAPNTLLQVAPPRPPSCQARYC